MSTDDMHDADPDTGPDATFETCDFNVADAAELAQIFRDAINVSAASEYSPEQLAAWARSADDEAAFAAALSEGWVRIAVDDEGIVGFAQLNMPGHLAMLYTAPRAARQGVATLLMDDMHMLAGAMGAKTITAEASSLARAFLATQGFRDTGTEVVERHGVSFTRYLMAGKTR
ncbi:GNAT family N-acetyltransferase [Uliginosibacterium sp. H3]|uniref:GNAT family N-acetyltransferase n=1 Tax=Uliginosibacterium silvisoli TaxID=3114758 RepID=A0ABU6JYE1_9RHOO|nr:GNAT family N-acetyltransferase [Uliginosibacterium sp. H3]